MKLQDKYDHHQVEGDKYDNWVKKGYFEAGDTSKNHTVSLFRHQMSPGNYI